MTVIVACLGNGTCPVIVYVRVSGMSFVCPVLYSDANKLHNIPIHYDNI